MAANPRSAAVDPAAPAEMPSEQAPAAHRGLAGGSFWIKSRLLIAARGARNLLDRPALPPLRRLATLPPDAVMLGRDASALHSVTDPRERVLELGKIQNLRVAAGAIDGLLFEPGEVFSFWRALGRPSRAKGYVVGRELRRGCLIPSIAGGICQMTNALSRAATQGGMTIVERHRHSASVDGLVVDAATDATVFWNYVDFRFRATRRIRIGATLDATHLDVRIDGLP